MVSTDGDNPPCTQKISLFISADIGIKSNISVKYSHTEVLPYLV